MSDCTDCTLSRVPAEDGCLEQFENTAAFSRDFQAAQDCMCDQEHMFKCPSPSHSTTDGRNDISEADIDRFVHEFQVSACTVKSLQRIS